MKQWKCNLCGHSTESCIPYVYPDGDSTIRIVIEKGEMLHSSNLCDSCRDILDAIMSLCIGERNEEN